MLEPVGQTKSINDFYIPQLSTKRRIWIYLPPDYEGSQKRYPVLYMHDGQNLFEDRTSYAGSWHIGSTLDELFKNKKIDGVIIVAVDNAGKNRMCEYNPWEEIGGKGTLYADFIVNTLKPYIDNSFRTKPQREFTGVMGSSMGAYISAYIALKNQNIFSKIGLLSPAFWLYKDQLGLFFEQVLIIKPIKIYLSVGTKEGEEERAKQYLEETQFVYNFLLNKTGDKNNIRLDIIQGGIHSESEWSEVFREAFTWLF
ncbi:MAG: alpha/beta hydrolase-fold protein [Proteobacteria bacterium]|nr:alpha/beta hydrolase-fold protein [Pseudomonadota bacterium]